MGTPLSNGEPTLPLEPGDSSLAALLECGLEGIRKGHSTEKLLLLALALEHLPPTEVRLRTVIEDLTRSYAHYLLAQQTLQEASKRFVEAEGEVQTKLALFEQLLSNFVRNVNITSLTLPGWLRDLITPQDQAHQEVLPPHQRLKEPGTFQASQLQPEDRKSLSTLPTLPILQFTCFGRFEVRRLDQSISLCHSRSGQAILRYLVAQPGHRASIDKLISILWPESELEAARHRLQVAISALRGSLNNGYTVDPGGGYILFKDSVYQLNPTIAFRSDVDEFLELYQAGKQVQGSDAVVRYEQACQLYTGPFLVEDMYADWSIIQREQLSLFYQEMCGVQAEYYLKTGGYENVVKWASAVLKENKCDEAAHRQLIQAYAAQGRRSEALRQYQRCEQILHTELGVAPMPETVRLCQTLFISERVSHKN